MHYFRQSLILVLVIHFQVNLGHWKAVLLTGITIWNYSLGVL